MEVINEWAHFGGTQRVYAHQSEATSSRMEFAVFTPAPSSKPPLTLYFLSGLTCTWENFVTKAGVGAAASEHGVTVVCPDTSPRGDDVPDRPDEVDLGQGAGFYVNATQAPWSKHFRMYDYVRDELPLLVDKAQGVPAHRGICGHSMGGHGALTLAIKNPTFFQSVSAFAPIVAPSDVPWGQKALAAYLGADPELWKEHDTCRLLKKTGYNSPILVDQGSADPFLEKQLRPELLRVACEQARTPLTLRMQPGYDHSYYFISTFIAEHVAWHRERAS